MCLTTTFVRREATGGRVARATCAPAPTAPPALQPCRCHASPIAAHRLPLPSLHPHHPPHPTHTLQPGPPLDLNTMADLFLQRNLVKEATAFLLEVLQDNDPRNALLQTKLLEINLVTNPQVGGA